MRFTIRRSFEYSSFFILSQHLRNHPYSSSIINDLTLCGKTFLHPIEIFILTFRKLSDIVVFCRISHPKNTKTTSSERIPVTKRIRKKYKQRKKGKG